MKNIFLSLILFAALVVTACSKQPAAVDTAAQVSYEQTASVSFVADDVSAPVLLVQDAEEVPAESDKSFSDILRENWISILFGFLGFVELIVRITPTEKDNSIFNLLMTVINAIIPNFRSGGGKFTPKTE